MEKWIDRKVREGEHLRGRRKYIEEIEWKEIACSHCGKMVKYHPREGWDGKLKCPHCRKEFVVPSLDGWVGV